MDRFLIGSYFYILLFEFCGFLVVLFLCRGLILNIFGAVSHRTWAILFAIFIIGSFLRSQGPHLYETYFDGYEYAVATQSLARGREINTCMLRVAGSCTQKFLPTHPPAANFLFAMLMMVFGATQKDFFNAIVIVGSLSILLAFPAAFLLFGKESIALWSAFILALLPIHIKLSSAGMLEIGEVFYAWLALFSLLLWREEISRRTILAVAFSTLLLVQSRAEAILFLLLMPLFLFLISGLSLKKLREGLVLTRLDIVFILLFCLLLVPEAYYVCCVTPRSSSFGVARSLKGFSLHHLVDSIGPNLAFYFDNRYHPVFVSVLAAIGGLSLALSKKAANRGALLMLSSWFFSFSFLFLLYGPHFGEYEKSESQHFALISYVPLVLCAAAGSAAVVAVSSRHRIALAAGVGILMLADVQSIFGRYVQAFSETTPGLIVEYYFVNHLAAVLPKDSFIVTINPNIVFADTDIAGVDLFRFLKDSEAVYREAPQEKYHYYFFWNSWCQVFLENGSDACNDFRRNHPMTLLRAPEPEEFFRSVEAGQDPFWGGHRLSGRSPSGCVEEDPQLTGGLDADCAVRSGPDLHRIGFRRGRGDGVRREAADLDAHQRRLSLRTVSRAWSARQLSTDSAARASPSLKSAAWPATMRAAAALRRATSKAGPRSPLRMPSRMRALATASPPEISSVRTGLNPRAAASISYSSMRPSRRRATTAGAARENSSRPSRELTTMADWLPKAWSARASIGTSPAA